MAGRLSFSIAINFLTENFKRGTSQVKATFKSMQMQFLTFAAALGAGGLGLSNFVSRLIDVARETNRVTTALKNVSGGMAQFADNQRFLIDMARKYGLEINALTANYAKFTAAASISGMSMMEQRKIFESVSRAVTAFGMSADDSNGVFLALSQMMSKGKISSEELRLQMGERLPVALQAMAKAAGTSVAGLDKLLKQGKLMSADILPKFADALNEMIPNVDTDNLETSVNRLKNAFTEFVNGTDAQSKYKALIDWLTGYVQKASDNIRSIITYLVTTISVMVISRLVNKIIIAISQAENAAKSAARRAAKDAGIAFNEVEWKAKKAGASIGMAFSKALGSLKSLLITSLPTAIIAVIGAVVAGMSNLYRESKRIKNIYSEYRSESERAANTAEIVNLQKQYKVASDLKRNLDERKGALSEINRQLGTNYEIDGKTLSIQGDINKKFAERVELLKAAAEVDYLTRKKLETEDEINKVQRKSVSAAVNAVPTGGKNNLWNGPLGIKTLWNAFNPWNGANTIVKSGNEEINELNKVLQDVETKLENAIARAGKATVTTTTYREEGDALQKQKKRYQKQYEELGAKLEVGAITQTEYNKALGELNLKMFAQAKSTGDKEVLESEYYRKLKIAAEKAVKDQDKNAALVEFEKIQKDYNDKVKEYQAQFGKGLISQKELNENLASLALDTAKSAAGIKGIGDEANLFIAAMQMNAEMLKSPIKIEPRDATFDYKKNEVDIASENLDKAKEYADKLKEQARSIGQTLSDEIANAIANVPTLEEALKLAQVKQDIKDFTKELNEGVYSGIKEIAGSSDRVVNAFSQLRDIMDDVDASGWEKVMAVWNAMTNVVDSFLSIARMIENMTELTNKLVKAKETEAAIESAATAAKVTNITTQTATEVAASTAKAEAATIEMAAKSTAAYAAIPFVGVGFAEAQIAAMQSLIAMAAVPKFANGGIVTGGPTSGDKILARVNAGEMILNQSQQSRLWQAIQSGRTMAGTPSVSQSMTTKVRGKDLLLTINNELKSQGKKPL
ncbi:tape measure protein [Bacteroides salyersiae]|uniref:tape measure protein n=1 Tax=Bacteroides salyersiae TaxID=291644 RepID=UPI001CCA258C|nr:tape measure protein [Bacteroides salyersiae]UBD64382.1 tape measure protein [Bacteroides salyersiae]